jgi:hypothetical protein
MEGKRNESKNAKPFKNWFEKLDEQKRGTFIRENYIPEDVSLEFDDFTTFFAKRKEMLRVALGKVVALSTEPVSAPLTDWSRRNEEIEIHEITSNNGEIE